MGLVVIRGARARWVLWLTLSLAAGSAWQSDAVGGGLMGWRSELLPPDTSGVSGHGWAARPEAALPMRGALRGSTSSRDSTRLMSASAREDPLVQPECSAPKERAVGLWGTDGNVLAMVRAANTLYIAGSFRWLGPNTGALVPLSPRTAAPAEVYAKVAGEVRAIASDGFGGWFIGGAFNAVGGSYRHNLAHILRDGRVADWDPQANGADVNAIAVSGRLVYVGGGFTSIGGQDRRFIAALDAGTGHATQWDPWSSGGITSLVVQGSTVFAGGAFDSIAGAHRENLAAIDAATGRATPWRMDAALQVDALLLRGGTLYAGGRFPWIGGRPRLHLAAIDVAADTVLAFNPEVDGIYSMYRPTPTVSALAMDGHVLYAGGLFTGIGGEARAGLAAIDLTTGHATPWNPGSQSSWTRAVAVHGEVVYAGGYFDSLGGQVRWGVGAVDRRTGRATAWNPTANGPIEALAVDMGTVYAGGYVSSMGPQVRRNGLAALDLRTGAVTAWNPNPVGRTVFAVTLRAGALYAGGDFISIGGQPRRGIAAVDTVTGAAIDWGPDANGPVETMVLDGNTLYAGGEFTELGGKVRSNLAAVDATTGAVTDWDPEASGAVYSLVLTGNTMYAAGYFGRMGGGGPGGTPRNNVAAFDATTGGVTAWDPSADSWVNDLEVSNGTVYLVGAFNHIGIQGRNGVAAIDALTGVATPWNPDADAEVKAVALAGGRVYLGGYFAHAGGRPRNYLVALDPSSGTATDWDAHADGAVWSLAPNGMGVFAGGVFTSLNGLPVSSLAVVADSSVFTASGPVAGVGAVGRGGGISLAPVVPNPVRSITRIRFTLPAVLPVSLTVLDLQGRCVSTLLNQSQESAGEHSVLVRTNQWIPGCYFCRLEAGGVSATRKILVVR